jgi:CxxC motif-containing protein (DUF1111 family)
MSCPPTLPAQTTVVVCALSLLAACGDPLSRDAAAPTAPTAPSTSAARFENAARDLAVDRSLAAAARTALSGGPLTVFDATADAFSLPAPNLGAAELALHEAGDEAFDAAFVPAPASANAGLGPVFDNVSCTGCHVGDGRGRPPVTGEQFESMLFRASVPGAGAHGGPMPAPGFGGQLQMRAIPGVQPGLQAVIAYTDSVARFADGTSYTLRVPRYRFSNSYALLPTNLLVSPRVAPAVFGLGLLEVVPEGVIRAAADPDDRDRDGVSGRVNMTWDVVLQRYVVGRFGWKAAVGSLLQQTAGAYNGDMGITSALFPAEPCEGYRQGCERHAAEVRADVVVATAFYQATLGVPARRRLADPVVLVGEALFYAAGCADCHTPSLPAVGRSGGGAITIHPYTDLLVHDMGPGLADNRPDFGASGTEWRTAPLWGIGLVGVVNGHTNFLHDGRARGLLEAVLWHDGEAARAREAVRRMPAAARTALVAFLQSL